MKTEDIKLNNAENFVTISGKYHGGNQRWYDSSKSFYKHSITGGCGPVTMADMIAYLAYEKPEKYSCLIPFKNDMVEKIEYTLYMETIFKFIKPLPNPVSFFITGMTKTLGVPFAYMMKSGIRRYAKEVGGISLKTKTLSNASINKTIEFISSALMNNCPAGMVVWGNKKTKPYEYHWMTIIKLSKEESPKKTMITVATWGELHELCLEDLYHSPNRFKWFGLITFDI